MGAKGRRWVERCKTLVILLLAALAVYLLTMTPLIQDSGVDGLFQPPQSQEDPAPGTSAGVIRPVRLVVGSETGRYGAQYDQSQVDSLFAQLGPLLGEALSSASQPQEMEEATWQSCLSGGAVYFDFLGHVPLSVLGQWLTQGQACTLTDSARRVLLAADGQEVALCYQTEEGGFRVCSTGLSRELHLTPILEEFEDNGVRFAFEDQEVGAGLDPYTLVTKETLPEGVYTASAPVSSAGDLTGLLDTLSFRDQNHASVSGGEVYLDGDDQLRVTVDGRVTYSAAQPGKYPVNAQGRRATVVEAVEAAWEMAQATVGAQCGSARIYLAQVEPEGNGWRVCVGYQLNGCAVTLGEGEWAAEFLIQGSDITDFTLCFRSYTPTTEQAAVLSMERAASILPDLTQERRELVLQYRDQGSGNVWPVWMAV